MKELKFLLFQTKLEKKHCKRWIQTKKPEKFKNKELLIQMIYKKMMDDKLTLSDAFLQ